mmetsp:Transcript_18417/g.58734  ORF Transcript_18417/g.58734 Transcript_18417/m.58734 type:complete len:214 (-) Transcript_18417:137-778(-)
MQAQSATTWTVGTVAAYLALYTAYDKATKSLGAGGLLDVLLFRKGADHTLVQVNKVISLTGLTTLSVALLPGAAQVVQSPAELLTQSGGLLAAHSLYSLFKYYGSPNIPYLSTFPQILADFRSEKSKDQVAFARRVSLLAGSAALTLVTCFELGTLPLSAMLAKDTLLLGVLHFYMMEIDYKKQLQVRPFGYLAFAAPAMAIVWNGGRWLGAW